MNQLIKCDLHDYLEIACMFHYQVKLTFKNGDKIQGTAGNIVLEIGREFLVLEPTDLDGIAQKVAINELAFMTVITPNALFKEIRF